MSCISKCQFFFQVFLRCFNCILVFFIFWLVTSHMFVCAENRRPSLRPSCIRPPLQLQPPLVWGPSTTLCLQTPPLLRASSFTLLMSSHRHPKPHPSLWPLLLRHPTRQCLQPLVLSWLTCFLAPWWMLGLSTWLHTRTHKKANRLVTSCSCLVSFCLTLS